MCRISIGLPAAKKHVGFHQSPESGIFDSPVFAENSFLARLIIKFIVVAAIVLTLEEEQNSSNGTAGSDPAE